MSSTTDKPPGPWTETVEPPRGIADCGSVLDPKVQICEHADGGVGGRQSEGFAAGEQDANHATDRGDNSRTDRAEKSLEAVQLISPSLSQS